MSDAQAMADALITAQRERTPILPFTRKNPFLGIDTATMDFKRHLVPADRVLEIVGA